MSNATVRYTYRIRPGIQAERILLDDWNRVRWIWNQCLAAKKNTTRRLIEDRPRNP